MYEERDGSADRSKEVFQWLAHQRVLGDVPALTVGDVPLHVQLAMVKHTLYGLRLLSIEQPRFSKVSPMITGMPVSFLGSRFGACLRVESQREEDVTHSADTLCEH